MHQKKIIWNLDSTFFGHYGNLTLFEFNLFTLWLLHCEAFGRIALKLGNKPTVEEERHVPLAFTFAVLAKPQNAQTLELQNKQGIKNKTKI